MAVVKPALKGALMQKLVATSLASLMFAGTLINPTVAEAQSGTTTPIKHLVVIFQENISFDHYFGTYPKALNPAGQPRFIAKPGTPAVNGYTDGLLYNNPNALNTRERRRGQPIPSASIVPRPQPPIRITTTRPNRRRFTAA